MRCPDSRALQASHRAAAAAGTRFSAHARCTPARGAAGRRLPPAALSDSLSISLDNAGSSSSSSSSSDANLAAGSQVLVPRTRARLTNTDRHGYMVQQQRQQQSPSTLGVQQQPQQQAPKVSLPDLRKQLRDQVLAAHAALKQRSRTTGPTSSNSSGSAGPNSWLWPLLRPAGAASCCHWAVAALVLQADQQQQQQLTLPELELVVQVLQQAAAAAGGGGGAAAAGAGASPTQQQQQQAGGHSPAQALGKQQQQQEAVCRMQVPPQELTHMGVPPQQQVLALLTAALTPHLTGEQPLSSTASPAAAGVAAAADGGQDAGVATGAAAAAGLQGSSAGGDDDPTTAITTSGSSSSSSPAPSRLPAGRVLHLLCQMQQLVGPFGTLDQQLVGSWLATDQLHQLRPSELGQLLQVCAQEQQLLRASWITACAESAVTQLQQAPCKQHSSTVKATGGGGGSASRTVKEPELTGQRASGAVQVLLGLAKYPLTGPAGVAIQQQYRALVDYVLDHATSVPPCELVQLLSAVQPLQLLTAGRQPGTPTPQGRSTPTHQPSKRHQQQQQQREGRLQQLLEQQQQQRWYAALASSLLLQPSWAGLVKVLEGVADQGWAVQAGAVRSLCTAVAQQVAGYVPPAARARPTRPPTAVAAAVVPAPAEAPQTAAMPGGGSPEAPSAQQVLGVLGALARLGVEPEEAWLVWLLKTCGGQAPLSLLPALLHATAAALPKPEAFGAAHRSLVKALFDRSQQLLPVASGEQLADLAESLAAFGTSDTLGTAYLPWHTSACCRVGKAFALDDLVRIQSAYGAMQYVPSGPFKMLLNQLPWRLRLRKEKQQAAAAAAAAIKSSRRASAQRAAALKQRRLLRVKRSRRRQRLKDMLEAEWAGPAGSEPSGRANWRARKLKPPGSLRKKKY